MLSKGDGSNGGCEEAFLKPDQPGLNTKSRQNERRRLGMKTAAAFFGYLSMGISLSILGPTLISMELLHRTDTAGIAWAFAGQRIGCLLGAAICGVFSEKVNPELLLGLACYLMAIGLVMAPFTGHLAGFILVIGLTGVGIGFMDSGNVPYLLQLWKNSKSRDNAMHASSIFGSLGPILTPLLIRSFLVERYDVTSGNSTGCSIQNLHNMSNAHTDDITVYPEVANLVLDSSYTVHNSSHFGVDSLPLSILQTPTTTTSPSDTFSDVMSVARLERSRYAYVLVGSIGLVGALLFTINFFLYKGYRDIKTKPVDKASGVKQPSSKMCLNPRVMLICLLFVSMFFYWVELLPSAFIATFAVKGLCMDVKTGSDMTSLYWGCHGLGRTLTVIIAHWVRPSQVLVTLFSIYAIGLIVALCIPLEPRLVWAYVVLAGLGTSAAYFSTLLWISGFIRVTGRISGMCISAISIGGFLGPLLVGNMFQTFGHMWLIYIQSGALLTQGLFLCAIGVLARVYNIRSYNKVVVEMEVRVEEIKSLKDDKTHRLDEN